MVKRISELIELRPELPVIIQNKDYHDYKNTLMRIDEILEISGIETRFVEKQLLKWGYANYGDEKAQAEFQKLCRRALRCNFQYKDENPNKKIRAIFYIAAQLSAFSEEI